jgi:hypothetical protein
MSPDDLSREIHGRSGAEVRLVIDSYGDRHEVPMTIACLLCPGDSPVADRPSKAKQCPVLEFRYSVYANEGVAPIRCASLVTGVMPGPGNGLHGSQCGDERPGACLLPHDEESMRSDGDAGIAWLLPEDPARRSR